MSIISLDGVSKTARFYCTESGPLDDKGFIEKFSDLAKIDTKYLIKGQSIFCKETAKEYLWLGNRWIYKLCNYIDDKSELENLDVTMIINGQILTCAGDGGHYIYLPKAKLKTEPEYDDWYLKEQLDFDAIYPVDCLYFSFSELSLPQPVTPAKCVWKEVVSYDERVLYINSSVGGGTPIPQSINVESHTLTVDEIPAHQHSISQMGAKGKVSGWNASDCWSCNSAYSGTHKTQGTGGGKGHTHTIETDAKIKGVTVRLFGRYS